MATRTIPGLIRHSPRTVRASNSLQSMTIARPISLEKMRLAHWLSASLAIVATVASAIGAFNAGIFRDPLATVGNAQGTALVILLVAVPTLIVAMIAEAQGSARAGIVWLGALGYILYNSVLFAFDLSFNRLFLAFVAMLALALWSIVVLLIQVDTEATRKRFTPNRTTLLIAAYLVGSAALFLVAWMRDFVPALIHNTSPDSLNQTFMLTNPIQIMDLSVTIPLMVLSGIWLWRRHPWGYLLSGIFLVMLTIETLSVAVDQLFGHYQDSTQSLGAVPLMIALTVIGFLVSMAYFRMMREGPTPEVD